MTDPIYNCHIQHSTVMMISRIALNPLQIMFHIQQDHIAMASYNSVKSSRGIKIFKFPVSVVFTHTTPNHNLLILSSDSNLFGHVQEKRMDRQARGRGIHNNKKKDKYKQRSQRRTALVSGISVDGARNTFFVSSVYTWS